MTIAELLRVLTASFTAAGIADPRVDAELLIGHVLGEGRGRVQALALMGTPVSNVASERVLALAELRSDRVPLQHLTGIAPFRSLELSVGPGVFVPRPETESVAQHAIDALAVVSDETPLALDLCTGSGALALALATEVPSARVWAIEKSADAHAWAARNVQRYGDGRVQLEYGDVTDLLATGEFAERFAGLRGRVHVLVSNPPYVPTHMVPREPEVRDHDPHLALFSGEDGLDLIRYISKIGRRYLVAGGTLVIEHAEHQGEAIRALLARDGWSGPTTHRDLTGRDRTTTAHSPETADTH